MNDEKFLKDLGRKIKILRTIKGLSQEDIMDVISIDRSYLSLVERGKANISILYLRNIAEALDIELSDLLDFEINMPKTQK